MAYAKPNKRFRNDSVLFLKCEDTAVSRSSRRRSLSGGWRLNRGYSAFRQGNIDPRKALLSLIQHVNVAPPTSA
eukprot:6185901-Pleurochrysis_carterae.AAC.2